MCGKVLHEIVGGEKAMAGVQLVASDPEIVSGTPVFAGTRVPVKALFDYLEDDTALREFLENYPSVSREQAVAVLEMCRNLLESQTGQVRQDENIAGREPASATQTRD
jgi:uncharacterized protein (DUF433 family)